MSTISQDIIILPEISAGVWDRWVIMNVFARTSLGVEGAAIRFLGAVHDNLSEKEIAERFQGEVFHVWDIARFSNADGLMADPSGFVRSGSNWGDAVLLDAASLYHKLKKHYILIDDYASYVSRFQHKKSLVDGEHFGNFHQQVGQYLLIKARVSPSEWWVRQKFTDDLSSIRTDNLYGAVQMSFLKKYFPQRIQPGDVIVDIGCGTGHYANLMAETGGEVLGVDPSEEYISIARKRARGNVRFEVMNVGNKGALDGIPGNYADFVYISDALLFYFVPYMPDQRADIQTLFADIGRILKPEGTFICLEPHYVFWLAPWLGSPDRPFTVITEYTHRKFRVTATISELVRSFTAGGFAVVHMEELTPDKGFESLNPRAYHFAREFPLWHLFELKKYSKQ